MKIITITTQEELNALPREFEKEQIVEIRAKEVINIKDKYVNIVFYANDSSIVNTYDSSRVNAYDSSRVNAHNSSIVNTYNSSIVNAYDSSRVNAHNSSRVYACDSSIVNAYDSSRVNAHNSSIVNTYNSSTVNAHSSSIVNAYDSSRVNACDSSRVYACDSSRVYAYNSSTVNAYNSSTVNANGSSTVYACGSSTVYACGSSTVNAYLMSTVFISSIFVTLSKLLDNSRAVYLINSANKPLIKDNKASITEFNELVTPTFDQWIERGVVFADGIYQNLISQKTIGEITVYETDQGFVVRKGDKFAHGKTIEEAKNDLRYKISDRDTSRFSNWKLSDVKSTDELIECYRTITGACSQGTKIFCESIQLKNQYSVQEIVDLTSGRFGNEEFRKFFGGGENE